MFAGAGAGLVPAAVRGGAAGARGLPPQQPARHRQEETGDRGQEEEMTF